MSKKAYIFSKLFRDVRMNSGLSQWIVSVKAGTHLSNVNQIEAGHQEPRVHVAVRLVAACDVDLNSFFLKLTEEMKLCTSSERIAPYLFESLKEDHVFPHSRNLMRFPVMGSCCGTVDYREECLKSA